MIEFVYSTLASLGYTHPLHPASTHLPMGLVLGAFLFQLASLKWEDLAKTVYYCLILALVTAPIAAVSGLLDWQHRLHGKLNGLIAAKLGLTALLMAVLGFIIYKYRAGALTWRAMTAWCALAALLAAALGLIGGELVYG
ncbi:MAG: hypothetical protein A2X32_02045 [Elusimicrobia bacterium GWC2_64_44]|nr:MAG: hypothetical protein A2X32_02045 [Elusimicrobia bacterium GWC2_64_44]